MLFSFVAFGIYMAFREDKNLVSNKKEAVGTVYETATYYQNANSVFIKFVYVLDNKQYQGQTSIISNHKYDHCSFLRKVLVGHNFPIIYDSLDFENSKILLSKKDYERYKITRPDSLNSYYHSVDSIQNQD